MRKGVSPLIAAVLLIAFTMAIAAILTAWIGSFTTEQEAKTAEQEKIISCLYKNIKEMEDLSYLNDTHFKTYMISTGQADIDIHRVQVILTNGTQPPKNLSNDITISKEGTWALINLNSGEDAVYPGIGITLDNLNRVKFIVKDCEDTYALVLKPSDGWQPLL